MRTRVNRMPLPRFSVKSTPFGLVAFTWKSLWSPMITSTPSSASAMSTRGPVGSVTVAGIHPFVAEGDDHLDALVAQPVGLGLDRVDHAHDPERPQPSGEEQARRVLGRETDEAYSLAVEVIGR